MTDPAPEYPEPVQPEDVLPDEEPATCGRSIDVAGPIPCRLSNHRDPMKHMGFYDGQPILWST